MESFPDLIANHQAFRRASLRYHPHVVYKKASLKPLLGQYKGFEFEKKDQS
jgi:hypothetical protein